ncbi:MAG TPA: hypothetical protein VJX68_09415 [Candidatus Binatus sp.]|uniref:hypothetical protein n=1 Tax=Candidatus Binatus sp. TaxID=2811406 RepID=UPI002B476023|nr:hypothetical protein [Candidatus Binatus sp.]HKN13402.1 hypothetical protein [Candidatus Binatus sp.]
MLREVGEGERKVITYRTVLDETIREAQGLCGDCAERHSLRRALIEAARKGDRGFLICSECHAYWAPDPADIAGAIRDWLLVFVPESPILAAILCGPCAAANPNPLLLRVVAREVLRQSPDGPMQ